MFLLTHHIVAYILLYLHSFDKLWRTHSLLFIPSNTLCICPCFLIFTNFWMNVVTLTGIFRDKLRTCMYNMYISESGIQNLFTIWVLDFKTLILEPFRHLYSFRNLIVNINLWVDITFFYTFSDLVVPNPNFGFPDNPYLYRITCLCVCMHVTYLCIWSNKSNF